MMTRSHLGRVMPLYLPLAIAVLLGDEPATAGSFFVNPWTVNCPPSGYLTAAQKAAVMGGAANPTTALDYDLFGNGKKTAWSVPIAIDNPAGGQFKTTDGQGSNVFLVGIPDTAGLGFGSDHYSPRFKATGAAAQGVEVGQRVYTFGRNLWSLDFTDNKTPGTPDQFTKSIWRSRNGEVGAATFDERTYFVNSDLTKDKIVVDIVVKMPGVNLTPGFSITASTIVNEGVELSKVQLGGAPIPLPGPSPTTVGVSQTAETNLPEENNVLNDPTHIIVPGGAVHPLRDSDQYVLDEPHLRPDIQHHRLYAAQFARPVHARSGSLDRLSTSRASAESRGCRGIQLGF